MKTARLTLADVAKHRILNGDLVVENDLYNNRKFVRFNTMDIKFTENGYVIRFYDRCKKIICSMPIDTKAAEGMAITAKFEINGCIPIEIE